jgi:putative SOS response-associated peptidase YedK
LTTDANAEVGAIHPKAMPVILTTPVEIEHWMTAPADADGGLADMARLAAGSPL